MTRSILLTPFFAAALFAQRPTNPARLIAESAPELDYVAVPNPMPLPAGEKMGPPAATEFDARGHLFVLNRGPKALAEYDENGNFVRIFLEGFTRVHGLRIDADGNFWITDLGKHTVSKFTPQGELLLRLGTTDQAGEWNETAGSHKFEEPTDVVFGRNGNFFISQGHTAGPKGDPRIFKFDKTGKFVKSWGGKGSAPGKFEEAHGMELDAQGNIWATDRDNQRIQIFDQEGNFIKQLKFNGLPCALRFTGQNIYMVNGFAGQLLKLDLNGAVLAAVGRPGQGLGQFGEAHAITLGPKGEILIGDVANSTVHKYVKK